MLIAVYQILPILDKEDVRERAILFGSDGLVWVWALAPPAMWETWVGSLDWEDPLEEGMATHSSVLAWRIPWTEEPDGLQPVRLQRGHNWAAKHSTHTEKLHNAICSNIDGPRDYIILAKYK